MRAADWPRYHYGASPLYTHDGDTNRAMLDYGDSLYSKRYLRLIGVWAPEIGDPGGPEAADELDRLISWRPALYVLTKRDAYSFNRLLAWLFTPTADGELYSVNDHMIRWLQEREIDRDPAREARLVLPPAA